MIVCISAYILFQNLSETIYVVEVLLNISTESSQNAPRVPPHPPKPGDKGVMQVAGPGDVWVWLLLEK